MRSLAFSGALVAALLAAPSGAAEIVGTVVSSDPDGRTVVVETPDGESLTIQTSETTRIERGDARAEAATLTRGTLVQVHTAEAAAAEPTATRIEIVPAQVDDEADDDVDVDIDEDDVDED